MSSVGSVATEDVPHKKARDILNKLSKGTTKEEREQLLDISAHLFPPDARSMDEVPALGFSGELALKETTDLIETVYGKNLTECIRSEIRGGKIRDFLETAEAGAQCNAVVGRHEPGKTTCWICTGVIAENEQQCEHKFSVAQAMFFTGLYDPKVMKALPSDKKKQYTDLLKKEYGWAHIRCNQVKSDTSFVAISKSKGQLKWVPDTRNITQLLTDIVKGTGIKSATWPPSIEFVKGFIGEPGTPTFAARESDIKQQVERILNVANGIDTRKLLASTVISLRKRAAVLHDDCWRNFGVEDPSLRIAAPRVVEPRVVAPPSPPVDRTAPPSRSGRPRQLTQKMAEALGRKRERSPPTGGGNKEEDVMYLLESLVKRASAERFFKRFELDEKDQADLLTGPSEEPPTLEDQKKLGASFFSDDMMIALDSKIEEDALFFKNLANTLEGNEKLTKLYEEAAKTSDVKILERWILDNMIAISTPGTPVSVRKYPRVKGSPGESTAASSEGEGSSQPRTRSVGSPDKSAEASSEGEGSSVRMEVDKDATQTQSQGPPQSIYGSQTGTARSKKRKGKSRKNRKTRRRIRLF